MHRFWEPVIEPILRRLRPKVIVEVGSQSGANTAKLLAFCRDTHAECHIIDTVEPENLDELRDLLAGHGQFHQGMSLDVLPAIADVDAYLIDGDHNWYTVSRELEAIERVAGRGAEAPLLIFHDVDWPYGARDLYYNPETIPADFRQPYAQRGLLPEVEASVEGDGINHHLFNAVRQGGPRNGVRTAIVDFVSARSEEWTYRHLPGMNGLGFVVPAARAAEPFAKLITQLCDLGPMQLDFLRRVERDRIGRMVEVARLKRELTGRRQERDAQRRALRDERAKVAALTQRLEAIEQSGGYRALQRLRALRRRIKTTVGR